MSSPVDRATPTLKKPTADTPAALVTSTNEAVVKITGSPGYAAASTDVVTNTKALGTASTNLDANNQAKTKAAAALAQAEKNEPPLVRRVGAARRALIGAVDVFADGSKETVLGLGLEVETPQPAPEAGLPENLRPMKVLKSANASTRWDPMPGAHGYLLQHATNPSDATTYSAALVVTRARYRLAGQTPGQTIYFRVAALDTKLAGGQTAYTAWVAVIVAA
jgi:hypothetical protein